MKDIQEDSGQALPKTSEQLAFDEASTNVLPKIGFAHDAYSYQPVRDCAEWGAIPDLCEYSNHARIST